MNVEVQEIWGLFFERHRIAITSHIHPDGDAIGSCLAMYHALRSQGKDVSVIIDDHVTDWFSILPGAECIRVVEEGEGEADLLILLDARMGRADSVVG